MRPFKVNGVRVSCADCVYFDLDPKYPPCDRCFPVVWRASKSDHEELVHRMNSKVKDVNNFAFVPKDIKKFKALEEAVKQYKPRLLELKRELEESELGSLDELMKRCRDVKSDISFERCFDEEPSL